MRLFTREGAKRTLEDTLPPSTSPDSLFYAERDLLSRAKRIVVFTLGRARGVYGDALTKEQELLGHVVDIAIEVYALESALLRTEKLVSSRGESACAAPLDITRVYASDAAARMGHAAR